MSYSLVNSLNKESLPMSTCSRVLDVIDQRTVFYSYQNHIMFWQNLLNAIIFCYINSKLKSNLFIKKYGWTEIIGKQIF